MTATDGGGRPPTSTVSTDSSSTATPCPIPDRPGNPPESTDRRTRWIRSRFRWTDRGWRGRPLGSAVALRTPRRNVHRGRHVRCGHRTIGRAERPRRRRHRADAHRRVPGPAGLGLRRGPALRAASCATAARTVSSGSSTPAMPLGMAVVLDVVYNHLGPAGNHLARFGPYFTDEYRTPWGDAVNLDGPTPTKYGGSSSTTRAAASATTTSTASARRGARLLRPVGRPRSSKRSRPQRPRASADSWAARSGSSQRAI